MINATADAEFKFVASFKNLIRKLLNKDPEQRPSAEETFTDEWMSGAEAT